MRAALFSLVFVALAATSFATKVHVARRGATYDLAAAQAQLAAAARARGFAVAIPRSSTVGRINARRADCAFTAWIAVRPLVEADGYGVKTRSYTRTAFVYDGTWSAAPPRWRAMADNFSQLGLRNLGFDSIRPAVVGVAWNEACASGELPAFAGIALRIAPAARRAAAAS